MMGTTRKTAPSRMIFIASAWVQVSSRARRLLSIGVAPAIAEPRVVLDMLKRRVNVAEFLPDTFYERADIRAETDLAFAGGKSNAMHDVIELAIADILARALHQVFDDAKLGEGQIDLLVLPEGPVHIATEKHVPMLDDHLAKSVGRCSGNLLAVAPLVTVENQLDAPRENLKAAGLLDEVDGTSQQSRFLVDLIAEHGQEDNGRFD